MRPPPPPPPPPPMDDPIPTVFWHNADSHTRLYVERLIPIGHFLVTPPPPRLSTIDYPIPVGIR
jgi:hypothetical protein